MAMELPESQVRYSPGINEEPPKVGYKTFGGSSFTVKKTVIFSSADK